jgi:hypothetical protein
MFSHAFEEVGKQLNLKMAHHEHVSDLLIRQGEVGEILSKELGSGFAVDVADVIKSGRPGNLYDAVVSSQFDADRLDYMQRDRLMTGVQNSGIDFAWLIANLEIEDVPIGVDEKRVGKIETFVLGAKASHAAETYVLALFQLYPTIYFHKATRAAEKMFSTLMVRVVSLVREGHFAKTGLTENHPIILFASEPESLEKALALDDAVFWGSLHMLAGAADKTICQCALALRDRRLPKCVDIRRSLRSTPRLAKATASGESDELRALLNRSEVEMETRLQEWSAENSNDAPRILTDRAKREPYKRFQDSKGPLNQIRIRTPNDIQDMANYSAVVRALEPFELFRAYVGEDDQEAKDVVNRSIVDAQRSLGDDNS